MSAGFAASVRRIKPLAWPVLVGQLSVLAFATVDTVLLARFGAADLAALAVGAAAYVTTFIGFMGVVLALGPIAGQLHGAGRDADAGRQLHQAVWIALGLGAVGSTLLAFPYPFLALARVSPEVEPKVRGYLLALAMSLPVSLLFAAYRAFNVAISRPKAVMALQLFGLALKVPLSALLIFGLPAWGWPPMGAPGAGLATCIAVWTQTLLAWRVLRTDPFYAPYRLLGRGLDRPDRQGIGAQLRLGLPMGGAILVEVTGFAFMAVFIARLGTTAVAGHQIAANLVSMLYMLPLAIAQGTSTLVAQRVGARDFADARRLGWHGMALGFGVAALVGSAVWAGRETVVRLYTADAAVAAAALPLLAWVALFHLGDALQAVSAFVLRAWRIATVPLVVNAVALWGVGLAGGYVLAFDVSGNVPAALHGAPGFWAAATAGLALAGSALALAVRWVLRQRAAPA